MEHGDDCSERRSAAWLTALRRYLAFIAGANLIWEILHLPLYTIWTEGSTRELAFAVLHCTGGDLLIAGISLILALMLAGDRHWPVQRFTRVAVVTIVFGVSYTVFSEWHNVVVQEHWAYSDLMPVLPLTGTGLSPLAQWVFLPLCGFWWVRRSIARAASRASERMPAGTSVQSTSASNHSR